MKKIIAIVVVALAVLHFGMDSTEGVRGAVAERTAMLESI